MAALENSTEVPPKIKTELPHAPAIPLLGKRAKKAKSLFQSDLSTPMFTAALCTMAKAWKPRQSSSVDGQKVIYTKWNVMQP